MPCSHPKRTAAPTPSASEHDTFCDATCRNDTFVVKHAGYASLPRWVYRTVSATATQVALHALDRWSFFRSRGKPLFESDATIGAAVGMSRKRVARARAELVTAGVFTLSGGPGRSLVWEPTAATLGQMPGHGAQPKPAGLGQNDPGGRVKTTHEVNPSILEIYSESETRISDEYQKRHEAKYGRRPKKPDRRQVRELLVLAQQLAEAADPRAQKTLEAGKAQYGTDSTTTVAAIALIGWFFQDTNDWIAKRSHPFGKVTQEAHKYWSANMCAPRAVAA